MKSIAREQRSDILDSLSGPYCSERTYVERSRRDSRGCINMPGCLIVVRDIKNAPNYSSDTSARRGETESIAVIVRRERGQFVDKTFGW